MRTVENLMCKMTTCKTSCWLIGRGCPCSCNYIPFPPSVLRSQELGVGQDQPEGQWSSSIPDRVRGSWVGREVRCDVPTEPCWVTNHAQAGP